MSVFLRCSKSSLMDVGDSRTTSCDAVQVLRGVAVHGIHEVWLSRALKLCPSVVRVRASALQITDLVCAHVYRVRLV